MKAGGIRQSGVRWERITNQNEYTNLKKSETYQFIRPFRYSYICTIRNLFPRYEKEKKFFAF
jgi:hypothetical protein